MFKAIYESQVQSESQAIGFPIEFELQEFNHLNFRLNLEFKRKFQIQSEIQSLVNH